MNKAKLSPSFHRYLAASTVSSIGDWISTVALSFALLETLGVAALGFALLGRQAAIVMFLIIGGVLADRAPRWTIIVASHWVRALCQVALGLVLLSLPSGVLWFVIGIQVLNGVSTAISRPAQTALVPVLVVERDSLQRANALLALSRNIVAFLGVAVGAGLVATIGAPLGLLVDGFTFLLAGLLVWGLGRDKPLVRAYVSPVRDAVEGFRSALALRWFLPVVANFAACNFLYIPVLAVLGPEISIVSYSGAAGWGAVLISEAAGAVIGALVGARLLVRSPLRWSVGSLLLIVFEVILLGLSAPLPIVLITGLLAGAGLSLSNTFWYGALQSAVPNESMGRLNSIDWIGSVGLAPIGYAMVPILATLIGTSTTLLLCGLAMAVMTLAILWLAPLNTWRPLPRAAQP